MGMKFSREACDAMKKWRVSLGRLVQWEELSKKGPRILCCVV